MINKNHPKYEEYRKAFEELMRLHGEQVNPLLDEMKNYKALSKEQIIISNQIREIEVKTTAQFKKLKEKYSFLYERETR